VKVLRSCLSESVHEKALFSSIFKKLQNAQENATQM
jgi:hypothetical protein